jgi:hypothetical protein
VTKRLQYPEPILVGYTVGVVEGIDDVIVMPQPPSNYGAEAAEKWRKDPEKGGKAREEAVYQSAFSKITGVLLSIFAVDCLKGTIFDSREIPKNKDKKAAAMSPAEAFLTWLLNARPNAFRSYPRQLGLEQPGVAFYGFDPKEFVRVLGAECNLAGHSVPVGLWYQNEECFDPYEMLVEADRRKIFPLPNLLDAVGIATATENYTPHSDAEEDARIAAELIHAFGLIAKYDEEKLYGIVQDNLTPIDAIETEAETEETEEAEAEEAEAETEDEAEVEEEAEEEYEEVEVEEGEEVEGEEGETEEYEEVEEEEYEEETPAPPPAPRKKAPPPAAPKAAPKKAPPPPKKR